LSPKELDTLVAPNKT
jgi:hypothetical protein